MFNIRAKKFHSLKYKEFFSGWIFLFSSLDQKKLLLFLLHVGSLFLQSIRELEKKWNQSRVWHEEKPYKCKSFGKLPLQNKFKEKMQRANIWPIRFHNFELYCKRWKIILKGTWRVYQSALYNLYESLNQSTYVFNNSHAIWITLLVKNDKRAEYEMTKSLID